jgi:hypothetical protein
MPSPPHLPFVKWLLSVWEVYDDTVGEYCAVRIGEARNGGVQFKGPELMFLRFNIHVGDIAIDQVKTKEISDYLDSYITYPQTWQVVYRLLRQFFEYWTLHKVIPPVMMPAEERGCDPTSFHTYTLTRKSADCSNRFPEDSTIGSLLRK